MTSILVLAVSLASGGLLSERVAPLAGVTLVSEAMWAQAPTLLEPAPSRVALTHQLRLLQDSLPSLGGPTALTVVGGALVVVGIVVGVVGVATLFIGWGVLFLAAAVMMELVGIPLTIVGAVRLGQAGREREPILRQIQGVEGQLRALDTAPPASGGGTVMAPSLRLLAFAL